MGANAASKAADQSIMVSSGCCMGRSAPSRAGRGSRIGASTRLPGAERIPVRHRLEPGGHALGRHEGVGDEHERHHRGRYYFARLTEIYTGTRPRYQVPHGQSYLQAVTWGLPP